jgi:N-acyl homoserine lactone hydrolase
MPDHCMLLTVPSAVIPVEDSRIQTYWLQPSFFSRQCFLISRTVLKAFLIAAAMMVVPAHAQLSTPPALRLYTLDCGRIDFNDQKVFADTGEHDGKTGVLPVSCFLIGHGSNWMLWDVGLGDEIAASPSGRTVVGLHFRVPHTLVSQLALLGLKPDDIRYVGLSHLHADHSGNVALFPRATFLLSPKELAWASAIPTPDGVRSDVVLAIAQSRIEPVTGDLDVFGDGTVRMISTPGHTPGHYSLQVQLIQAGPILLSGDVAHFKVNYDNGLVPTGNVSRAETLASIGRVKGLERHFFARVVIQHAWDVFDHLPKLPNFLE